MWVWVRKTWRRMNTITETVDEKWLDNTVTIAGGCVEEMLPAPVGIKMVNTELHAQQNNLLSYWKDYSDFFHFVNTVIQSVQLKSGLYFNISNLFTKIYNMLYYTTNLYITQLTCIYSKCWKWCPFISMHLSTRFTMFLTTFLSVPSFTSSMARVIFIFNGFRSRGLLR